MYVEAVLHSGRGPLLTIQRIHKFATVLDGVLLGGHPVAAKGIQDCRWLLVGRRADRHVVHAVEIDGPLIGCVALLSCRDRIVEGRQVLAVVVQMLVECPQLSVDAPLLVLWRLAKGVRGALARPVETWPSACFLDLAHPGLPPGGV